MTFVPRQTMNGVNNDHRIENLRILRQPGGNGMRSYCLVVNYNPTFRTGTVVNMCLTGKPTAPVLNDYQRERGMQWIPVEKVSQAALNKYQYWNERP